MSDIDENHVLKRLNTRRSTVRVVQRTRLATRLISPLHPAVFLDRDGTLMEERDYCKDPSDVTLLPGVREALERLKIAGYKLIIITNQSGIGRGLITEEQFEKVQAELFRQLGPLLIDATYVCKDAPHENSNRRKPSPIMVLEAMGDHRLDPHQSFMIGDKAIDIECGLRAGTKSILVLTGYGRGERTDRATFVAETMTQAAEYILRRNSFLQEQ